MRSMLLAAIALLACCRAGAVESQDLLGEALNKRKPNELSYFLVADGCPFYADSVVEIVEGVFIRSRIKPVPDSFMDDAVYLHVELLCIDLGDDKPVYKIDVMFGNASRRIPVLYPWNFGTFGKGSERQIKAVVKDQTEQAITAYLKANFDL